MDELKGINSFMTPWMSLDVSAHLRHHGRVSKFQLIRDTMDELKRFKSSMTPWMS